MSDQQMQFADPEWRPPQLQQQMHVEPANPQPVNDRSTEQTDRQAPPAPEEISSQENDYARGYQAQQTQQQSRQSTFKHPPRARGSPWFWIILAFLLFMTFGGGPFVMEAGFALYRVVLIGLLLLVISVAVRVFLFRGHASPRLSTTGAHTFQVGQRPRIVIKNERGSIRVQPGEDQEVRVEATGQSKGWMSNPAGIPVHYDQDPEQNRVTVKAEGGWALFWKPGVDFVLTVPRTSNLELKTDAGTISVTGVNGQMSLTSGAGSVRASEVVLQGDSRLKTDAGSVTFAGSLDPFGTYQFVTDAGTINVTLPEQASFQLEAKTDVGSFNSDFPVEIRHDFPGQKARGEVGIPPYPKLKLKTDIGSISLRKGSF